MTISSRSQYQLLQRRGRSRRRRNRSHETRSVADLRPPCAIGGRVQIHHRSGHIARDDRGESGHRRGRNCGRPTRRCDEHAGPRDDRPGRGRKAVPPHDVRHGIRGTVLGNVSAADIVVAAAVVVMIAVLSERRQRQSSSAARIAVSSFIGDPPRPKLPPAGALTGAGSKAGAHFEFDGILP